VLTGSIFVASIVLAQLGSVQLSWTGNWGLGQSESVRSGLPVDAPLRIQVERTGILIEGDPVMVSDSSSVINRFFVSLDGKPT
jgi:hypothetical protein